MDKRPIYTSCQIGKRPIRPTRIDMNDKYNLIPGACHFLSFFSGNDTHLRFSYTDKHMYCRRVQEVAGTRFDFVEARPLGEDSENQLDAMASDDYIGPMYLFGNLPSDRRALADLEELFRRYSLCCTNESDLRERLKDMESDSDQYIEAEALLEFNGEEMSEVLARIESSICEFNRASGYDPKSGTVK